ncbi:hypothetical protein [Curvivirga aplysinae]|uniref:hypothetical protein n=1 Tax=Curvivirga aplysinae TaxID=2529852 RepID=UPI0012BB746C|nr:hypothetical protein [Curvivirga aplysinae]MTI08291.1 hypothetical protein [Curvivirga aplysinae]
MLGFSLQKIIVLGLLIAAVWYGFKYIGRLQRVDRGERKKGERTMGERIRKAARERSGVTDAEIIEDTEKCPRCGIYIPVGSECSCKRK